MVISVFGVTLGVRFCARLTKLVGDRVPPVTWRSDSSTKVYFGSARQLANPHLFAPILRPRSRDSADSVLLLQQCCCRTAGRLFSWRPSYLGVHVRCSSNRHRKPVRVAPPDPGLSVFGDRLVLSRPAVHVVAGTKTRLVR